MKKLLFITLALASTVAISARVDDWAAFSRYETANATLSVKPKVVFMGNSITDGWPDCHPAFFSENGFAGRGISGQTSYQFLSRFRQDVVNLHPMVVVINAGTNDVAENTHAYNEDRTMENIMSMVDIARANGIEVVLTSVLPAASFWWNKAINDAPEKISSLNRRIEKYARENNIPYADYHSAMLDTDGRSLDKRYSEDGVHPNSNGYDVMEQTIMPILSKQLKIKELHK